jgi:Tol biopolymer transport system component
VESVDWSRNGRWLALSVTSYGASNPYNGIHVVDLVRGTDRQISPCRPPVCDWLDLAWSPDGSKLAYVVQVQAGKRIHIVDRNGAYDRPLPTETAGDDWSPAWSPSGDAIAYATRSRAHRAAAVWIQRLDGSHRRLLATGASYPAWAPDGHTIAVLSHCGGIKLLTPSGRDVTPGIRRCRVVPISGIPVWSPDGDQLAIAGVMSRQAPYRYPLGAVYLVDRAGHRVLLTRESGGRAVNGRVDASWQPPLQPGGQ